MVDFCDTGCSNGDGGGDMGNGELVVGYDAGRQTVTAHFCFSPCRDFADISRGLRDCGRLRFGF